MVAIKAAAIKRLLSEPGSFHAYLVFGLDEGLVHERAAALAKALARRAGAPVEHVTYQNEDLQAAPERLSLDLKTISMFGERKIIRVNAAKHFPIRDFEDLLDSTPFEADLIIEAGDLKKTAKLRKIFETKKTLAAIPCYHDKKADLDELIAEVLTSNDLSIDEAGKTMLAARLGADRALSRRELEKLALYCQATRTVTLKDIDAVLGDMSEIVLDKIITATLAGEPKKALNELQRVLGGGTAPTVIFLALLRQLHQLYRGALDITRGQTIHAVAKAQQPPLYFERRDNFIRQLNLWSEDHLARAISKTEEIMGRSRIRSHPELEQKELEALLLMLAAYARQRS